MSNLIRVHPLQYVHILDKNSNILRLELGPQTLMLQSNEALASGPLPMIVIPPGYYCVVNNPVKTYEHGVKCELYLGETRVRFHGEPFALYPGEYLGAVELFGSGSSDYRPAIKPLPIIPANTAMRLRADLDHTDERGVKRLAGDRWQLRGPCTYKPRHEVIMEGIIKPTIIKAGQVLKLRALEDTMDSDDNQRVTGEEWLVKEPGAYLPGVFEEVVSVENVYTLTPDTALHLKATQTVTDLTGKRRQAGEEWLLTGEHSSEYSTQVGVVVVKHLKKTVLKKGEYAVILNPVDKAGRPQLGQRELRVGLCSFFLHPDEALEGSKIQKAHVLSKEESLVLQATHSFEDTFNGKLVKRKTGDIWQITGPLNYIPPIHVKIVKRRKTIPLSKNEGIYVQDSHTGQVRLVMGPCAYMLTATEDMWEKELSEETEELLSHGGGIGTSDIRKLAYFEQSIDPQFAKGRNKTFVVTYRCPSNTAVQIYNYKKKTTRIIFGPDLAVLGPHEDFHVLRLSAGKPKREGALRSLCLMLGPDFITDILEVETSDHARLRLQLAFNNYFEVDKNDAASVKKIFAVPDFIGFASRQIASRIRASVALTTFDNFHRYSAPIIQAAVFGPNSLGDPTAVLKFDVNNLVISSIDIQSIEPVDTKMRDSLSKSVQLAIEISTKSIEAAAAHEASREEQMAKGQLERQTLNTEKEVEIERTKLYELRALSAAVESTGQAKAEAQAKAESDLIEYQSEVDCTKLIAEVKKIDQEATLEAQEKARRGEMEYQRQMNEIVIGKERAYAELEVNKFSEMVESLGAETLVAMANAGPENQLNLLKGLGLESVLLTDGNSPINLLNTAAGLVGGEKQ